MDRTTEAWLEALERRHLADFTMSEVARALRALSSCYVERRSKLASGAALSSAGKRSAFALFYGPLHFFVTREIVTALPISHGSITDVIDLGCGTGAAGAGLAVASRVGSIRGFDRHRWAVSEASWTYRQFGLRHRVVQANVTAHGFRGISSDARPGTAILAAYAVNELAPEARSNLLASLRAARAQGASVLVVEPIARRLSPWWRDWQTAIERAGGRADEWRFPSDLPPTQRALARAAGLDPRELTARSLFF
jgi:hypothetical protein